MDQVSPNNCGIITQTSDVKIRAETKVIFWLQQKEVNVIVEISIQKAAKWITANARANVGLAPHAMNPRVAAEDQVHIP
jgi:hypothetical protein